MGGLSAKGISILLPLRVAVCEASSGKARALANSQVWSREERNDMH